jgi:hypothetical protein
MSLPSLAKQSNFSSENAEEILLEALKIDLPLGWSWFEKSEHGVALKESPNSPLGKQIVRICAATGLRGLVEKYLLGGKKVVFANCCDVIILSSEQFKNFNSIEFQIQTQNGVLNHADC